MTGEDVALVACVVGLVALAGALLRAADAFPAVAPGRAVARGAAQLAVVALVLRGALEHVATTALVVVVMLGAVAVTAGNRLGGGRRRVLTVAGCAAAGAGVPLAAYLGTGAVGRGTLLTVAFAGILLGGTMTACTLAGRRLQSVVEDRYGEVEAALALGLTERQAIALFTGEAIREALVPALDQTRTTGLVTLPGAFVGALAGGASPADAARFQIAVLAGIMTAQAIAATLLLRQLALTVLREHGRPARQA